MCYDCCQIKAGGAFLFSGKGRHFAPYFRRSYVSEKVRLGFTVAGLGELTAIESKKGIPGWYTRRKNCPQFSVVQVAADSIIKRSLPKWLGGANAGSLK
jgi:hypothetical protein